MDRLNPFDAIRRKQETEQNNTRRKAREDAKKAG